MRGDESHDGAAEEDRAKHGEDGGDAKRGSAGRKVGPDGARARFADPAGRLPAHKIALELMAIPGHGPSVPQHTSQPGEASIDRRSKSSWIRWPQARTRPVVQAVRCLSLPAAKGNSLGSRSPCEPLRDQRARSGPLVPPAVHFGCTWLGGALGGGALGGGALGGGALRPPGA